MKTQENPLDGHRMVPKKIFSKEADEELEKRSRSVFNRCLTLLGLDVRLITECFAILSAGESEKYAMMQRIPDGFEEWATIGMFIKNKGRVDQFYRRMLLRNSSSNVRSSLRHESNMERSEHLIRKLKNIGKGKVSQLPSLTPSFVLSSTVLTNKALKRTRTNLFNAFRVAYYDSEEQEVSPGMPRVISHWLSSLEAYRVSLRLDGKHEYPKAIQHGDIFLKILWQECQPKTRKAEKQPRRRKGVK